MPETHDEPLRAGDRDAFERLYAQWSEPVFRYLVHLQGNAATAEDLFQETWAHAIQHRRQLREPQRFGAWIFRIARNLTFNHLRTHRRKAQVWIVSNLASAEGDEMADVLAQRPDKGRGPRDRAIDEERRRLLQDAFNRFDPATQEMLQLRFFEQMTLAEVAEVMDVPLGTVCTKIHRALKSIRTTLEQEGHTSLKTV